MTCIEHNGTEDATWNVTEDPNCIRSTFKKMKEKKKGRKKKPHYVLTYCYNLEDGKGKIIVEEEKTLVLKEDEPANPDNPGDDPTDDPSDDPTDNPSDNPTDKPVDPNPSEKDSGCKKDVSMVIISLISLSSLLVLIRKRK